MGTDIPLTWSVVIPVKVLARAKSRLTGLADGDRQALVLAMAADTVATALTCPAVGAVVVVSDDITVRAEVTSLGAQVVPDGGGDGLNEALSAGAAYAAARWPGSGLAALTADLPALSAGELAEALTAAVSVRQAFVADASGIGTTLYAAVPGAPFRPRFGGQSRQRHRQAGATELDQFAAPGLKRDVDRIEDLRAAARIGLGQRSAALAARLGLLAREYPSERY
ncbi:MAG TPA: 2-phospho-L-lactate guanylyltransferase [Streptosporangiaceae bacterium]